ncbi:MAG: Rossmann-like domain-containing protein [Pyrinomonadaceae bacterium]
MKIDAIFLSNYFNVLRLSDGSTAASMNYFRFKSEEAAAKTRDRLRRQSEEDPLLLDYLGAEGEPDLLRLSLKACVVSALSQRLLAGADSFRVTDRFDPGFFPPSESAMVIGFGGYMDYLIYMTDIRRIHVSDLWVQQRAGIVRRRLESFKEKYPGRELTFSDGSDNRERLAGADLVSVTGSAFCTGTMDGLLDAARNCRTVIVQGQSAAILPEVLFERGVSLVSTSVKPANLVELAVEDPQQFKSLLEGKLPKIYFTPLPDL